ncbi:hypothetical protein [Lichenifustis flavocetrariae]|uniref:Uncharacterized protein n=1 Tax=Lichenifustis flavocetrariae TaxID=2949735 RepID=A0AA41YZ28_9HYPH|nr:hypothetical protein [Lichenifustis flavocetrariae]MCW6509862.1 hypothetical protein [Lichenifustis flavocetrariae]
MSSLPASTRAVAVRTFRSAKTAHAVPIASDLVETALVQASLDPEVLVIAPVQPPTWSPDAHPVAHFVVTRADERIGVHVAVEDHTPDVEPSPDRLKTVVLRPADLRAEPFANNVRLAWACARRWYPAGDQVRILRFLQENGESSLIDAAQAASASSDPVATLMAMACRDLLELDLRSGPLGPETRVARRLAP